MVVRCKPLNIQLLKRLYSTNERPFVLDEFLNSSYTNKSGQRNGATTSLNGTDPDHLVDTVKKDEKKSKYPDDQTSLKKSDVKRFHVHRTMAEGNAAGTHKERMVFTSLMDSLLEQKRPSNQIPPTQTLFQQSTYGEGSDMDLIAEDVGKVPLSASLLRGGSSTEEFKHLQETRQAIQPVLDHITQLETDQQVLGYYLEKIVGRALELDSVKTTEVADPESPPITSPALPLYLELVLKLLMDSFESPTAANSAFELSKRASLGFYTAACSVNAYNMMIQLKWKYYRDFYAIDTLVSEMNVNAVPGNEETVSALGLVNSDFLKMQYEGSIWNKEDSQRMYKLNQYRMELLQQFSKENLKLAFGA